ncbi:MAG: queuosine precursor transporter [Phycisphaerales bacterium JB050]
MPRASAKSHHNPPLPSFQHEHKGLARLPEAVLHWRRETIFLVFAGLFLGSLTMLNILGITRFIKLHEITDASGDVQTLWGAKLTFAVAIGVLPYPITFLCTDFISEFWGRRRANAVVWVGFLLNLWVVLILWVGGALPGFEERALDGSLVLNEAGKPPLFFELRGLAFGAVTASMVAYLVAQLVDVHVFHFWKKFTNGKHLWLRNNGSTLISQLVDTVAVILITHYYAKALPISDDNPVVPQLIVFIVTGYAFKVIAALIDTVPFYIGAHHLARFMRLPPAHEAPHPPAGAAVEAGVG